MEEENNNNVASQKSPASREGAVHEVTETVEEESSATDSETITAKRKRISRSRKDEDHDDDHANVESSPVTTLPRQDYVSDKSSMKKRSKGRPKGSGHLQFLASVGGYFAASAGGNFCPYALTINPGEDMVGTIMSFATMPKQAVCVLAATGAVSKVHISTSNAQSVHEGSYDIIKLSGSYECHKMGKKLNMTGGLSIQLAAPDGKLIYGLVVGSIIAKEPIQLIIGTFKQNVISDYLKRKYSLSAVARDSETSKTRFVADENQNSTALDVAPLQTAYGEAEPVLAENENATAASPLGVDENDLALQVWHPTYWGCNQMASSDTAAAAAENENWNPASP